ncbi:Nrap protein [Umbelopsis sp. PMI_123]|nr:Nrap protein [Umbelopsis sp. PMI_123]
MVAAAKRKAGNSTLQKPGKKVAKVDSKSNVETFEDSSDDAEDFIGDDAEDLMSAAASGKYDDMIDDNDEEEEDSEEEDEEFDDDEEEVQKEVEKGVNGKASSIKLKKNQYVSELYQPPTNEEMQGLKETSELFKSNIFKMEIDELLKEVDIDYKKMTALELVLHRMKALFDQSQDINDATVQQVEKTMKEKHNITIPFPQPGPPSDAQYKFAYKKPAGIHLVGSYALKSISRTRKPFNVDVAIEMPSSLFQEKDYMNFRYFYKRAYYLSVLASLIKDKKKGMKIKTEFSLFNGDMRRPILVLRASGDKSETDFTKSKCVIRLIPCIGANVFPVIRLGPSRNNVRPKNHTEVDSLAPTPQYNAALLQDTTYTSSLAFIYQHEKRSSALKEAIKLARVWLYQRGLASVEQGKSGFNTFIFTMIMCYLLQGGGSNGGKKLAHGFSSYQLLRGTIDFLATHDFVKSPVFIGKSDVEGFSAQNFVDNYDVVVVDVTGTVNLTANVSRSTIELVQHEAALAMKYFNDSQGDQFNALFLTQVDDMKVQFDNVAHIQLPSKIIGYGETEQADYPFKANFFSKKLYSILKEALTDRISILAVTSKSLPSWNLDEKPSKDNLESIQVGLMLSPENASRLLELGPSPEEKEACDRFRKLWGNKAELRRFKDGSIRESVVFECSGAEDRSLIVQHMVAHLLQHHFGITSNVEYSAGQLYAFINHSKVVPQKFFSPEIKNVGFQPVMTAFDNLVKQLRALDDGLPLMIANIHPASPTLRFSTVFLPQPHDFDNIGLYPTTARFIEPIDVVIQFETSGKWPDDLGAIQNVKQAFLLKVAEQLKEKAQVVANVVDEILEKNPLAIRGYLDVQYSPGYVFRCRIQLDKEIGLLKTIKDSKNESKLNKDLAQEALDKYFHYFHHQQAHTFSMKALCSRFAALSFTMRIAKRWFSAHLLSPHVTDEFIELICAYVFLEAQPWQAPGSIMSGFARVVHLLATWDYQHEPLILDIEEEMTVANRDTIRDNFNRLRARDPQMKHSSMFIATQKDLESQRWSRDKPSKIIAARIQVLARAACTQLEQAVLSGSQKEFKRLFVTPMQDYSAIIRLIPNRCTRYIENLSPEAEYFTSATPKYRNLVSRATELGDLVYVQFDPAQYLVDEIQRIYGDFILPFHDKHGGDHIAIVWNPLTTSPRPWKVNQGFNAVPVDIKKGSKLEGTSKLTAVNFEAILAEIERLGEGIIAEIECPSS